MGINYSEYLNLEADKYGNEQWILPHGMMLQVKDFYTEETCCEIDRTINYIILSNNINDN